MTEKSADHAEDRLGMSTLAVQGSGPVRPVLPEAHHLLIEVLRSREVLGVLLYAVQRHGTMLPGSGQALLAMVGRVGQASLGNDVVR